MILRLKRSVAADDAEEEHARALQSLGGGDDDDEILPSQPHTPGMFGSTRTGLNFSPD